MIRHTPPPHFWSFGRPLIYRSTSTHVGALTEQSTPQNIRQASSHRLHARLLRLVLPTSPIHLGLALVSVSHFLDTIVLHLLLLVLMPS
eukprot:9229883-Pyramimonas_sp.AAC.2